jgi:hypothetical protein
MHKHFYFKLHKEDNPRRYLQSRAMHVMAALFLLFYGMQYIIAVETNWIQLLAILPPSILIIVLVIFKRSLFTDPNNNRIFRILEIGFLMMGCMHFLQKDHNLAALLYGFVASFILLIMWMENRIFHDQYIDFKEEKITIELPLYTKSISWDAVKQVMIKNHYLSVEYKDLSMSQYNIIDSLTVEEKEAFFEFCKMKLK